MEDGNIKYDAVLGAELDIGAELQAAIDTNNKAEEASKLDAEVLADKTAYLDYKIYQCVSGMAQLPVEGQASMKSCAYALAKACIFKTTQ